MADESDPRKLRAHELLDRAAVALEDVPRHLVVAGKDAPDLLRVLALAERGRARDVAEEDGDGLPRLARRLGSQSRTARVAEPCLVAVLDTAAWASRHGTSVGRDSALA